MKHPQKTMNKMKLIALFVFLSLPSILLADLKPNTTISGKDIWYFAGTNNLNTISINAIDNIILRGVKITNWNDVANNALNRDEFYDLYTNNISPRFLILESKTNDWNTVKDKLDFNIFNTYTNSAGIRIDGIESKTNDWDKIKDKLDFDIFNIYTNGIDTRLLKIEFNTNEWDRVKDKLDFNIFNTYTNKTDIRIDGIESKTNDWDKVKDKLDFNIFNTYTNKTDIRIDGIEGKTNDWDKVKDKLDSDTFNTYTNLSDDRFIILEVNTNKWNDVVNKTDTNVFNIYTNRINNKFILLESKTNDWNTVAYKLDISAFNSYTNLSDGRLHILESRTNDWNKVENKLDSNIFNTYTNKTNTRVGNIENRTNDWNKVENKLEVNVFTSHTNSNLHLTEEQINKISNSITSAPPQTITSVNGQTGAVVITANSIGALASEEDLRALRLYHYGDPDIVESSSDLFVFIDGIIVGYREQEDPRSYPPADVVIPWEIGGWPVTTLATLSHTEYKNNIKSVRAPRTLTNLYPSAFNDNMALKSVIFPSVEVIRYSTFMGCFALSTADFASATNIEDAAFMSCNDLKNVTLPSLVSMTGHSIFVGCFSLESIKLPSLVSITAEYNAFYGCNNLKSIELPSLRNISGMRNFYYCNSLKTLKLPSLVNISGDGNFQYCLLLESIELPTLANILGEDTFSHCENLQRIELPKIVYIANRAFEACSALTNVILSSDAPLVGNDIFQNTHADLKVIVDSVAAGYGDTLGGKPVIRLPLTTSSLKTGAITLGGVERQTWPEGVPLGTISNMVNTIGDSKYVKSQNGSASNVKLSGYVELPQSQSTNLYMQVFTSNEYIIVREVWR